MVGNRFRNETARDFPPSGVYNLLKQQGWRLTNMQPDKTRELLKEWQVNAAVPPNFDSAVWRRIEKALPTYDSMPVLLLGWLNQVFARPAIALCYVSIALVGGLALGQMQGSRDSQKTQEKLKTRYIQSIDPYAKPIPK
jgi:hypothetical protein